jgi:acetoin utilization deacetylase AcuC-like enzyme
MGFFGRSPRVQLVYSRRYQLEVPRGSYDSQRGERILAALEAARLLGRAAVHPAEPAAFRHLRRIHTDDYLDSLNRPQALTRIVGYELSEDQADRFLETQRTMVGGTLAATRLALDGQGIAVNLGGGLHHAFADHGERFCAYNDVAAAVAELRSRGVGARILVVDLDLHDGDGTRSLLAGDPAVQTFSIHNYTTAPVPEGSTAIELGAGVGDGVYLEAVRSALPPAVKAFDPELVFYLAGCDPAADDQIGDWKITAGALLERDRFVLSCARDSHQGHRKLPLVIVLAGGYGQNAWRYSARVLSCLLNRGRAVEPPSTEELLLSRYRAMAQTFEEHELTGEPHRDDDDWGLSAEDVAAALGGPRRPRRLLGFYSRQGLELAVERAGFLDRIRNLGFEWPFLEMDVDNPPWDTVRLYGDRRKRELLIELRVRVDRRTVPGMSLLRIEWLLLQNPRARFTPDRPQLPGQTHPGLGLLQETVTLMVLVCDRLQLDGVIFVPSHYHIAAHGRKTVRFLNPEDEGLYRALQKALGGLALTEAAEAIESGRVVDTRTGKPFVWSPAPMVFPVSDRFRAVVETEEYGQKAAEGENRHAFTLR